MINKGIIPYVTEFEASGLADKKHWFDPCSKRFGDEWKRLRPMEKRRTQFWLTTPVMGITNTMEPQLNYTFTLYWFYGGIESIENTARICTCVFNGLIHQTSAETSAGQLTGWSEITDISQRLPWICLRQPAITQDEPWFRRGGRCGDVTGDSKIFTAELWNCTVLGQTHGYSRGQIMSICGSVATQVVQSTNGEVESPSHWRPIKSLTPTMALRL